VCLIRFSSRSKRSAVYVLKRSGVAASSALPPDARSVNSTLLMISINF